MPWGLYQVSLPGRRGSQTQLKTEAWPATGVWAGGPAGFLDPFLLFWLCLAVLSTTAPSTRLFHAVEDRLLGRAEKETQAEELNSLMKARMPDAGPLLGGTGNHWSEQRGPPGYCFSFSTSLEVPSSHNTDHIPWPCLSFLSGPGGLHQAPSLTLQLIRCPRIRVWRIERLCLNGNFGAWWWILWG